MVNWFFATGFIPAIQGMPAEATNGKGRQFVGTMKVVEIEKSILRNASIQSPGSKFRERKTIAKAFVANSIYNYPYMRKIIDVLKGNPNLKRVCGVEPASDIPLLLKRL